jgi:hypothetical protein
MPAVIIHPLDDLGDEDVVAMAHGIFEVRDGLRLPTEVQLHRERPAEVIQDRLQADGGLETADSPEDPFERREIRLHQLRYPRILDLNGHPASVG